MLTRSTAKNFLLLALLAIVIVIGVNFNNMVMALHHQYFVYEPDAYMRLVIVSDLFNHHHWYQHFSYRINPPWGSDTHAWTRPIDILLIAGTLLFNIIMPLQQALYMWSFYTANAIFYIGSVADDMAYAAVKT